MKCVDLVVSVGVSQEEEDTGDRARRSHPRPQYIRLASETSDIEPVVLYPEGCDDRVSLAGR